VDRMTEASAPDRYGLPPEELRWRLDRLRDAEAFLASGASDMAFLDREALARDGKSLKDFDSILDLGCGCGRLTRRLRQMTDAWATIHGADADAEAIAWCKQNMPDISFTVHGARPPLPYPDHSIGLVLAYAFFTRLDREQQFNWLAEVQRVLRPGGYLLAAFHYRRSIALLPDGAMRERILDDIARSGISCPAGEGPQARGEAYQSPEYVRRNWGSYFEVRHILANGDQEVAVMRVRESTFLQRVFQRP
jgi:SAM-dependent methyltransferase